MKKNEIIRWLHETRDNFGDDMWGVQIDAIDEAIKVMELLPELVETYSELLGIAERNTSYNLDTERNLLKRAKGMME